ncbi:MAG: hypothetical protein U0807_09480 [Candidatus Binatia bacterium]
MVRCLIALVLALLAGRVPSARAQPIGTDLAALNLCLYGDCEARGSYAADPFGWTNPATLPVGVLGYVQRGVIASPSYFRLNVGRVAADIESGTITAIASPFVAAATVVYAEAEGTPRSLPGLDLRLRLPTVRLAVGADLDRWLGVKGLAVGLLGELPGTTTDLRLAAGGTTFVHGREDHEINLTGGVHWRGGRDDWFMAGAFLNGIRNRSTVEIGPARQRGTTDAWFARGGVSLLPFVPLGLAGGEGPVAEWLGAIRLGADVEHRNIAAPGEGARIQSLGYFGLDVRLLPDAWNPVARWVRVYAVGGVDTDRGWGIGPGLYGNGPLEFLSCNPAYSSRPLSPSFGDRVDIWTATCSVMVAL